MIVFLVCVVCVCLVAQFCPNLCDPMNYSLLGSSVHGDSPGKKTGVGCHVLFQGIFPTQISNPGLSHCRWILYQLSHKGSPRIQEWVAYPFSRGTSQPRNRTGVSCTSGGFFTSWASKKPRPLRAHCFPPTYFLLHSRFCKISPSLYLSLSWCLPLLLKSQLIFTFK